MIIRNTRIKDLWIVDGEPFFDPRGEFCRLFCCGELSDILSSRNIEQINLSSSKTKGTIRGMHFQHSPYAEMKMVRCLTGRVLDVVIDLRRGSDTFLEWHAEELSGDDHRMLVIPEGFAHGFQTLEDNCDVLYLHTAKYHPESAGRVNFKDPRVGIDWPLDVSEISAPDRDHPFLVQAFEGLEV